MGKGFAFMYTVERTVPLSDMEYDCTAPQTGQLEEGMIADTFLRNTAAFEFSEEVKLNVKK